VKVLKTQIEKRLEQAREHLVRLYFEPTKSFTRDDELNPQNSTKKRAQMKRLWKKIERARNTTPEEREAIANDARSVIQLGRLWLKTNGTQSGSVQKQEQVEDYIEKAQRKLIELGNTAFYEAELASINEIREFNNKAVGLCVSMAVHVEGKTAAELQNDTGFIEDVKKLLNIAKKEPNIQSLPYYEEIFNNTQFRQVVESLTPRDTPQLESEVVQDPLADLAALNLRLESLKNDAFYQRSERLQALKEEFDQLKDRILYANQPQTIQNEFDKTELEFSSLMKLYPEESDIFQYLTDSSKEVMEKFWAIQEGDNQTLLHFYGSQEKLNYAQENNLSHADVAAIQIYSNKDHKYINAASQHEL